MSSPGVLLSLMSLLGLFVFGQILCMCCSYVRLFAAARRVLLVHVFLFVHFLVDEFCCTTLNILLYNITD